MSVPGPFFEGAFPFFGIDNNNMTQTIFLIIITGGMALINHLGIRLTARASRLGGANLHDASLSAPARSVPTIRVWRSTVSFGPDHPCLGRAVGCDLRVSSEPYATLGLGRAYDFVEDPDPRAMSDVMGVHRQQEQSAFVERNIEFPPKDVEHHLRGTVGSQAGGAIHVEINGVVTNPFDRQLDDPGGLSPVEQFVGLIVGHK